MQKTTVMLHEETINWLRDKSHKERTSIGDIIRKAINVQRGIIAEPSDTPIPTKKEWKQITKCDMPLCRNQSLGEFRIDTSSTDTGDASQTKYLCNYHKNIAKKEGKVTPIE